MVRHSNVHVDLSSSSPEGEELPSDGQQEWETGSYELEESVEAEEDESFGPVVVDMDQQPDLPNVKGAAKRVPEVAGGYESDEDTLEFFPTPPIKQEIGINKRDASGNLMGRKLDCSASSYKQTLTLSTENNKVSCIWGGNNGKTVSRKSGRP